MLAVHLLMRLFVIPVNFSSLLVRSQLHDSIVAASGQNSPRRALQKALCQSPAAGSWRRRASISSHEMLLASLTIINEQTNKTGPPLTMAQST
jgi:hypothetical protein